MVEPVSLAPLPVWEDAWKSGSNWSVKPLTDLRYFTVRLSPMAPDFKTLDQPDLPGAGTAVVSEHAYILWHGPREMLWICSASSLPPSALAGYPLIVRELTDGLVALVLEGPAATAVLARGTSSSVPGASKSAGGRIRFANLRMSIFATGSENRFLLVADAGFERYLKSWFALLADERVDPEQFMSGRQ